jgi:hypothetical protein
MKFRFIGKNGSMNFIYDFIYDLNVYTNEQDEIIVYEKYTHGNIIYSNINTFTENWETIE